MAMTVLPATDSLPAERRSAVTIGVYDGVHAGHRWLLRKLRHFADREGLPVAVVTFDPHPLWLLRPVAAPRMLTNIDQRLSLIEATGLVDYCMVVPFDDVVSRMSPEEFIREVLVGKLNAGAVLVGQDFRFGHHRDGSVADLQRFGAAYGFSAHGLPLLPVAAVRAGSFCSSTYIRQLIAKGDLAGAATLLGRPHEVVGRVIGTSRPTAGRGVPTVVVRVGGDVSVPAEGSYAGSVVTPDGRQRRAGISVRRGPVPESVLLDAHVVGDVGQLMDETVRVRLNRRLWARGKDELFEKMVRADAAENESSAAGGWAAMR